MLVNINSLLREKSRFLVLSSFHNVNTPTMADFKLPTWLQLAHKISESLITGLIAPLATSFVKNNKAQISEDLYKGLFINRHIFRLTVEKRRKSYIKIKGSKKRNSYFSWLKKKHLNFF